MSAHNYLVYASDSLHNVEFWIMSARWTELTEVEDDEARRLAARARKLADMIDNLRRKVA